ncbi:hypothetical protein O6H91_13G078300 [Diphasiastrum complanatum]|uniref:Uncharacterized protein n=1 Tax=Diphasiastrum complanatum TaxID=34168 RepID=A0ACC2BWC1_DIPCM|nr:hypothetical protein O6H91_13G078300 [Diphasiastrum complanatum]
MVNLGIVRLGILLLVTLVCGCGYVMFSALLGSSHFDSYLHCRDRRCFPLYYKSALRLPFHSSSSFSSSHSSLSSLVFTPLQRPLEDDAGSPASTSLANIVFGIAASARLWDKRKEYVSLWWRADAMRGFVWLDQPVGNWSDSFPAFKISANTSHFRYTNRRGRRSALRISRVVSETFRMGLSNVHWFVMGDDDTFFATENLIKVLSKYDHRQFYYIGANSESHFQNLNFSYNMAYGGGGFALSYPLAEALEKMQDDCLHRNPSLYGSDDRMHACMAELGVPLTKEPGFHQFDICGDASGLLAAHPVTPLISLHHLDAIYPVFPNMSRVQALEHLNKAIQVDHGGIFQQSICYDKLKKLSFSVSWGYVVQVARGIVLPQEFEVPTRTFTSWHRKNDEVSYAFNTRSAAKDSCKQPVLFYMQDVFSGADGLSTSNYTKEVRKRANCQWTMPSPDALHWIHVVKAKARNTWHHAGSAVI